MGVGDRVKVHIQTFGDWLKIYGEWHKWFAWFPVTVDKHLVWLEFVERRYHFDCGYDDYSKWLYRMRNKCS